jgi:hypothetical protein
LVEETEENNKNSLPPGIQRWHLPVREVLHQKSRWEGDVAHRGYMGNAYNLMGIDQYGRPWHRWKDKI